MKVELLSRNVVLVASTVLFAVGCRSTNAVGTGGAGGTKAATGGAIGTGGALATGGAGASGGSAAAGGSVGVGGSVGGQSGPTGGRGGAGTVGAGGFTWTFSQGQRPKLDLLFMVDDSQSMAPLQAKMAAQLGSFMDALVDPSTHQLPDLHVAVISSSFGGGAWTSVNQCSSGQHPGDDQGFFQQGPGGAGNGSCAMLHAGETFLQTGDGTAGNPPTFDGDIRDAFKCIALLGDNGCGFESQFESTYYALVRGAQKKGVGVNENLENGGFLRDDAKLAIVMLTNEDDCSIAGDSLLLDPAVNSARDVTGLGALWSYRCNEFGHLCDGQPPPHDAPASAVTLNNCVSAEDSAQAKNDDLVTDPFGKPDPTHGHLWPTVKEFSKLVKQFKSNPEDVLVAAIAGPPTPYVVIPQVNAAAMGETDAVIQHSCMQPTAGVSEYADPAVRIKQWVDTFGANGIFYPICSDNLNKAMVGIADKVHQKVGAPSCIVGTVAWVDANDPSQGHRCQVTRKSTDTSTGVVTTAALPECNANVDNVPCYKVISNPPACPASGTTLLQVCLDSSCLTTTLPTNDSLVGSCAVL